MGWPGAWSWTQRGPATCTDGVVTEQQLREHAARSLARFKVPVGVHFVAELPHSLAGKVSRARLRELGLERAAAAAATEEEGTGA